MTGPFDPIAGASTLAELQDAETTDGWLTHEEIAEAVVHLIPYTGLPRALAALRMVNLAPSERSSEK